MTETAAAYPFFGAPPARQPRPVVDEPALPGKRAILSTAAGFVYDMRAVSRAYLDDKRRLVVDIVSEEDYYRWMLGLGAPCPTAYPARLVWVE